MIIKCDIIRPGSDSGGKQDYDKLIFKIIFENNINADNIKFVTLLLNTLIAGGAKKILVDMKDIVYIDSTGIGVFINTAKTIRTEKGEMAFLNVPARLTDIFKVVRLHEYIKMFDSREEAVKFLT